MSIYHDSRWFPVSGDPVRNMRYAMHDGLRFPIHSPTGLFEQPAQITMTLPDVTPGGLSCNVFFEDGPTLACTVPTTENPEAWGRGWQLKELLRAERLHAVIPRCAFDGCSAEPNYHGYCKACFERIARQDT